MKVAVRRSLSLVVDGTLDFKDRMHWYNDGEARFLDKLYKLQRTAMPWSAGKEHVDQHGGVNDHGNPLGSAFQMANSPKKFMP
jgi:hypothetical protein